MKKTEVTNERMKELEMIAVGKAITEYFCDPVTILKAKAYGEENPQIKIYAFDGNFCWQVIYTTNEKQELKLWKDYSGIMDVNKKNNEYEA